MSNKKKSVFPVILAGGSGTRLWPLSRELTPKQLIKITGEDSLLEQTINRAYMVSDNPPIVVTNNKIYGQVDQSKLKNKVEFLLEPEAKNTAPAIALAVKRAIELDPEAIVVILSADHHIDDAKFTPYLEAGINTAELNKIVLVGINPTRPETGYGYIKMGKNISEDAYEIDAFTEKPEKKKAEEYLKGGKYLWNAGIFIAKASVLKKEFEKYLPELFSLFSEEESAKTYAKLESVSIDNGLLEKTKNIAVVRADAIWNDLGSWGSIYDISPKDKDMNYLEGNVISENTKSSLVLARGNHRIATIGLIDVVVVDTEDVTLVCDRDQSQNVKKIVEKIKQEPGNKDYIEHKTMHRPWGKYTILDEGEGFKVKFIHVNPGAKLSLQSHNYRSEHWVVVRGQAIVTIGGEKKNLNPNESIYVPLETKHRLENPGKELLTIVEVATGDYIEEDDITRYDDVYERA